MIEFLKYWGIAAVAMLLIVVCSQGLMLIIEWANTLPMFWRATVAFTVSSMIAGAFMKALFGRG